MNSEAPIPKRHPDKVTVYNVDHFHVATHSAEAQSIHDELHLDFGVMRKEFFDQAVRIFSDRQLMLMKHLRSDSKFKELKNRGSFVNEAGFIDLATDHHALLLKDHGLENPSQQAALLSVLAQLDAMQDADMLKKAA